jgi:REP element-mobilizing transposase RayT
MSDDLPDRHSIRLKGFDYSSKGYYFVTICTHNRKCVFGAITDNIMHLNQNGEIVASIWNSLPNHHSVQLDEFQIMPNHIHFVVGISGGSRPAPTLGLIVGFIKSESTKHIHRVGATPWVARKQ